MPKLKRTLPRLLVRLLLLLFGLLLDLSQVLAFIESSSAGSGGIGVKLRVNVTGHLISLSCEVTGIPGSPDDHRVQFHCPLLNGGVTCFGDCSPICTMLGDGTCRVLHPLLSSDSVRCQKLLNTSGNAKTVRLLIDSRKAELTGSWFCKFRGAASATAAFGQFRTVAAATTATTVPAIDTAAPAAAASAVGGADAAAEMSASDSARQSDRSDLAPHSATNRSVSRRFGQTDWQRNRPVDESETGKPGTKETDGNLPRMKPDYVIGALAVLGVSLVVNIGFCLRCILARHYIELRRRKQQPPGCLGACLCVSTVQVTEDETAAAAAAASGRDSQYEELPRGGSRLTRSRTLPPGSMEPSAAEAGSCRALYDPVAVGANGGVSRRESHGPPPPPPHPSQLLRQQQQLQQLQQRQQQRQRQAGNCRPNSIANGVGAASASESAPFLMSTTAADEADAEAASVSSGGASSGGGPNARLELSRRMLRKADTLLREANSLLREGGEASAAGEGQEA
ncbi:hypothetical protein BOX15_Mlig018382g1 [Macrostomum lignano]|uniref:Ig-like domain-containing protein n=1 Tax=Macrostomum lignano TaxID=282301 RepID=A0A267FXB6_9PLAT|nr:hypothetical protein BOX15_Mlig018382g1 [Macrostomum lignano]